MNGNLSRDSLRISEEAAQLLNTLEFGGAAAHSALVDWLRASPRHVEEFLLLTASEAATAGIDPDRQIDVDAMIAQLPANVVPLQEIAPRPHPDHIARAHVRSGHRVRWAAGIAAISTGLLAAWMWLAGSSSGWHSYSTPIGEQRSVELDDGSLVQLNARSRLEVRLSGNRRDVRLLDGEALFKVAHDSSRPFRVHSGETVVRAVGTQFNVRRGLENTTVSVIEGRVQISREQGAATSGASSTTPQLLTAGEQARIVPGGQVTRATVNSADVAAWWQRRLVFRDNTLGEIADEFNRYNRDPQIIVEDPGLRARRYGGTFDADDPKALIKFLSTESDLIFQPQGSTLVIRLNETAAH